ncbi:MAG TPA: orotate phosphoribosyltransferase [bacterium]|nr:orotate phosphoribosyltransferase [bacterium]
MAGNADLLELFKESGALLEGHFLLTSGLHSSHYLQCALFLQFPANAERVGRELAEMLAPFSPTAVVSPAVGGILVGHEVARALGLRAVFTERESGVMTLRRGFSLKKGEKVVVVEDVVTTGGSVADAAQAVERAGAEGMAYGAIIDRSGGQVTLNRPLRTLTTVNFSTFKPAECPLCRQGTPAVKPGSRGLK